MKKDTELVNLGFINSGKWYKNNHKILFSLDGDKTKSKILYAFVVNKSTKYIGKTIQPIQKRLYAYQNPEKSQNTNIRIHNLIHQELDKDQQVSIYIFNPKEILEYKGIKINLAAGLEDELIYKFKPEWNYVGK